MLQRRPWWKTEKQLLLFPVAMGDEAIALISSWNSSIKLNWIVNRTVPTLTIDILSASRWMNYTCQKIVQRMIFVSWNIDLSSAKYFRYAPRFLLCSTSGLRDCSIFVTSLLAAAMALEGILIKTICHVHLPSRPYGERQPCKILLYPHLYSYLLQSNIPCAQTTKVMFLLKLR